jgi:hypothetical protein
MRRYGIWILLLALLVSSACTPGGWQDASASGEAPALYPDYKDIVIPGNIAPMNFNVLNPADACVAVLSSPEEKLVLRGPEIHIPEKAWRRITASARGGAIQFSVYIRRDGKWLHLPDFRMEVSADEIDPYVTYRLIEPGYSSYGNLVLRQRDLTSFREQDLYNNQLISGRVEQQCINCHSFQNYSTENFQFHARETSGGTVVVTGDKGKKVAFKTGDLISNAVYPSWHPSEPLIAYSVNKTAQGFFRTHRQKIEVYDSASDLILYDVEKDQVRYIVHDSLSYETFPYWSADGKTLYYASSYLPDWGADPSTNAFLHTDRIRYNIYSIGFNPQTREFGTPRLVFDAVADSLSAVTPRPSPDGRFLLSGVGNYGSFHVWHESGDIYITDLATGETRPMEEINSNKSDSFKAWSSNSRWIVFTSRRDDGSYTRLYFTHFGPDGRGSKPFLLPQKDPSQNRRLFKSYNVPEFSRDKVRWSTKQLEDILLSHPVQVEQIP